MAEKKLITEESLVEHPEWKQSGLVVGDAEPKTKKNTVEVDADVLKDILSDVQALKSLPEVVEKLKKENAMLVEVADKNRLANWQMKNNPQGLVRTASAWVWNDKLVKATITVKNEAFTDTLGRIHTDQVLNVFFEDGKEQEVPLDQFSKQVTKREGEIVGKNETENGIFYTLKFKDGKKFEVNHLFIN